MPSVRYIGTEDPTDDEVCSVFGLTFQKGEFVNVSAEIAERLSGNPTFEAKGRGRPAASNEEEA